MLKNMKILRIGANMSQNDVANYLKCNRTTYTKYETGASEPPFEVIRKLAILYNETTDFVMGDVTIDPQASKSIKIPVLGDVAAGLPIEAVENIIDYEEISIEMAARGEYFALRIKGQSMEPRIRHGDIVIVRKQEHIETGEIGVVIVGDNEATVKQVKITDEGITLIPSNAVFNIAHYSTTDVRTLPITILGKVVELRAKF